MEVPKEILVVPLKLKQPRIKNKKKVLQVLTAGISIVSLLVYFFYFPAPSQFSFKNTLPIGIMITLVFFTSVSWSYIFVPFKKALLIAAIVTATLVVNRSRIITIITYAICLPLLLIPLSEKAKERYNQHNTN